MVEMVIRSTRKMSSTRTCEIRQRQWNSQISVRQESQGELHLLQEELYWLQDELHWRPYMSHRRGHRSYKRSRRTHESQHMRSDTKEPEEDQPINSRCSLGVLDHVCTCFGCSPKENRSRNTVACLSIPVLEQGPSAWSFALDNSNDSLKLQEPHAW